MPIKDLVFNLHESPDRRLAGPARMRRRRPQAIAIAQPQKRNPYTKKLGIEGKAFHVLFCLLFLHSAVATPYLNLSRDSLPQLETVEHLIQQLRRMNAVTFYRELIDWLLNNVTDWNMFLVQSLATCVSLGWCV
jgi:hypothetical protein